MKYSQVNLIGLQLVRVISRPANYLPHSNKRTLGVNNER